MSVTLRWKYFRIHLKYFSLPRMDPSTGQTRQICQKLAELTKLTELERNVWAEVKFCQPAEIINVHFQWARDPTKHIKTSELQQAGLHKYLYILETPWFLRKQIGSTQMSIVLKERSHYLTVFHKEEFFVFIFYCNVYELKQKERKNL